ncbi:MAG TPA: LysM peptidoglycan-binding domain-containing protein [Streptosporangiaceae bacterium]|nr:LysM peptidoglycan-binding domain-containing protein [Streptosporangiaceae bacterium]
MSVMATGKPRRLTRGAVPAQRRAGAADRGQLAAPLRAQRRTRERRDARAGRHLYAVPTTVQDQGIQADPAGGTGVRAQGMEAVSAGRAGVQGIAAAPGGRAPRPALRAGDARGARPTGQLRDARPAPARYARPMPARGARRAPARSTVRLTRRGRIVVGVLLTAVSLLLVTLAWMAVAARAQAASSGPPPGAVYRNLTSVVVHPGQTLWSIASQAEPSADPRVVMNEIVDLNALQGTSVEPGQRLWVPRG